METKLPKAYCSDFTMRLGPATTTGRLVSLRASKPKEAELKYCTPDAKPVRQVYIDENGKIYDREDLGRARIVDGELEPVPIEDVVKAKESKLPLNTLNLTVHSVDAISQYIFPSDNNAYVFQPIIKKGKKIIDDPINLKWHDFINAVLQENRDIALIGECNLQSYEGLFRLSLYQGHIIVQKQLYPENLNQFDFATPGLAPELRETAVKASRKLLESFEPSSYKDVVVERLVSLQGGSVGLLDAKPEQTDDFDLAKELEAFLSV